MSAPQFTRRIDFTPSFDKRNPKPSQNYGIGSMRIRFVLIGAKGAVQWMIGTEWFVASAREHLRKFDHMHKIDEMRRPQGYDLGYHAYKPVYEGQSQMDDCDILNGPCFYDGSGLNAELLIEPFLSQGEEYLWPALEAYYAHTFNDAPWPFDKNGNLIVAPETVQ